MKICEQGLSFHRLAILLSASLVACGTVSQTKVESVGATARKLETRVDCLNCLSPPDLPVPLPKRATVALTSLLKVVNGGTTSDFSHPDCGPRRTAMSRLSEMKIDDPRGILILPLLPILALGSDIVKGSAQNLECAPLKAKWEASMQALIKASMETVVPHALVEEVRKYAMGTSAGRMDVIPGSGSHAPAHRPGGRQAPEYLFEIGITQVQVNPSSSGSRYWVALVGEGRIVRVSDGTVLHSVVAHARTETSNSLDGWLANRRAFDNSSNSLDGELGDARKRLAGMLVDEWIRPALGDSSGVTAKTAPGASGTVSQQISSVQFEQNDVGAVRVTYVTPGASTSLSVDDIVVACRVSNETEASVGDLESLSRCPKIGGQYRLLRVLRSGASVSATLQD